MLTMSQQCLHRCACCCFPLCRCLHGCRRSLGQCRPCCHRCHPLNSGTARPGQRLSRVKLLVLLVLLGLLQVLLLQVLLCGAAGGLAPQPLRRGTSMVRGGGSRQACQKLLWHQQADGIWHDRRVWLAHAASLTGAALQAPISTAAGHVAVHVNAKLRLSQPRCRVLLPGICCMGMPGCHCLNAAAAAAATAKCCQPLRQG